MALIVSLKLRKNWHQFAACMEELEKNIFMEVQKTLQSYNLQWNQLSSVTVDGGKNMAGKTKGLIGQIQAKLVDILLPRAHSIHGIIHQQTLCGQHVDISCELKPVTSVVNFIQKDGLNHRLFQTFLEEIISDCRDLPFVTYGKVLLCFYYLWRKIDLFLTTHWAKQQIHWSQILNGCQSCYF